MPSPRSTVRPARLPAIALVIAVAVISACRAALPARRTGSPAPPTVIVLSLDGWRWDYHTKATLPAVRRLIDGGVRAEGLIPGFPSKTFPNHYSIVTGLYPGHHGVIGNSMVDPAIDGRFTLANREQVGNAAWWGGEPLWVTVLRQGRRASALFWPGSEAPIAGLRPSDWSLYDGEMPNEARVDRLLAWLDRPVAERPVLLLTYLGDADEAGHTYGPGSAELTAALIRVDRAIGRLLAGLDARGLTGQVNVVLVSDHGMAPVSRDRVIALSDYLDLTAVDVVDVNPNLAIVPKTLSAEEVYHGYDPAVRAMHGLFVASGPAFKTGVVVPAFENVDIYGVLARVLGVVPAPNDGDPRMAARLLR
jgi:predicted AlkP superfamily pyrophosphatase or phosphodiesterase